MQTFSPRNTTRAHLAALIFLGAPFALATNAVQWTLHDNDCANLDTPAEILCGDYGRFYVDTQAPTACTLRDAGNETPPPYFIEPNHDAFPEQPTPVFPLGRAGADLTKPRETPFDNVRWPSPWIAIIDFHGDHGNSVEWLIQAIAGESVASAKYLLDADDANVNDLDVLSRLCAIAERSDALRGIRPVINMSFGRALSGHDPVGGRACQADTLSCQISQVIDHLKARGAVAIGAAGKERWQMFPAALDSVVSAATLDPTTYATLLSAQPTWEMPENYHALMPGSSLCLRGGYVPPGGASYASAVTSGWVARAILHNPHVHIGHGELLTPLFSSAKSCMLLSQAGGAITGCNDYLDELFAGLGGGYLTSCWDSADQTTVTAAVLPEALPQPGYPGVVLWDPALHPAPEGDPCVPCTGGGHWQRASDGPDFFINFAHTRAMDASLVLDAMHLRVDDAFYQIELGANALQAFRQGLVAQLDLIGAAALLDEAESASIFFTVRDASAADCSEQVQGDTACAWTSSHLHRID